MQYYIAYVSHDEDPVNVYGPAANTQLAIQKMIDYIEVGLVDRQRRLLTEAEVEFITANKTYITPLGTWYIVAGRGLI